MAGITHSVTATGTNSADQVSVNAWNAEHVVPDGALAQAAVAGLVAALAAKQAAADILAALAALDGTAGILRVTGAGTVTRLTDTAAGRALLEAADAAAQRLALGLGTAATTDATAYATAGHDHAGVYAPTTRTISTTAPLSGGGDLSADRTFAITTGVANSTDVLTRGDGDGRYPSIAAVTPAIMSPAWATYQNTTSVISIGSTTCPAWYFGRTPKALTTVHVRVKPAVVISGVTWCELALATGPAPIPATNATLTVVGYFSTGVSGAPFNSTNAATVTIPVSGGQTVNAGDHLWLTFAKLSTGSPSLRASPVGDEMSTGRYVDGGNVRPSVILGTPTSFTIGATSTLLHVFHVYI